MSLLGSIVSKILHPFGGGSAEAAPASTGGSSSNPASTGTGGAPASGGASSASGGSAGGQVDVEQVLNDMASKNPQKLNWRTSIIDLMKLLDLDSSLRARKQLADELHYTGDTSDSASMNIWLHRQVMNKLAANGGKVPADLKD